MTGSLSSNFDWNCLMFDHGYVTTVKSEASEQSKKQVSLYTTCSHSTRPGKAVSHLYRHLRQWPIDNWYNDTYFTASVHVHLNQWRIMAHQSNFRESWIPLSIMIFSMWATRQMQMKSPRRERATVSYLCQELIPVYINKLLSWPNVIIGKNGDFAVVDK